MMIAVDVEAVNMGRCIENKLRDIADVVKMQPYDLSLIQKKQREEKSQCQHINNFENL